MSDPARIKRNIAKMIAAGAPESEIDQYVASERTTPAQLRGEAPKPKPVAPTKPKPRPPLSAYAGTPSAPRPAPRVQPSGKLPVQPELLAPMQEAARRAPKPARSEVRVGGPSVKDFLTKPVATAPAPLAPGVASIFGDTPAPYQAPEFDINSVPRQDTSPIATTGGIDRAGKMAAASFQRVGTGALRVIAAGMNAIDEGFGDSVTARADQSDMSLSRGFEGATSLNDLKTDFSLGKLGAFAGEQMASSVGDMANLATGIGIVPYALQQAGNIGQQRAQNNGTGNASLSDILTAAPAAAASAALERLGTKYLLGEIPTRSLNGCALSTACPRRPTSPKATRSPATGSQRLTAS